MLEIDRTVFGAEHPRIAQDLENLAVEVFYRKKVGEAIELLQHAKRLEAGRSGTESLFFAKLTGDLASAYQQANRFSEAKDCYREAIHAYEASQTVNLPQFAICLHQYANLLRQLGEFADAELAEVRATHAEVKGVLAEAHAP